jgi:hypothetical protein
MINISFTTNASGQLTMPNVVPGSYQLICYGKKHTPIFIQVPANGGIVNLNSVISTPTSQQLANINVSQPTTTALTKAQADALYQTILITGSTLPMTSSWAITASFSLAGGAGSNLSTGSLVPITSSWASNAIQAISASYATFAQTFPAALPTGSTQQITASVALVSLSGGTGLITGSLVPITASVALIALSGGTGLITGSLVPITASRALTASTLVATTLPNAVLATDQNNQIVASQVTCNTDTLTGKFTGSLFGTASVATNALTSALATIAASVNPNVTLTNWTSSQTMSFDAQFNPKPQIHVIETGAKFIIDAGNYSMFLSSSHGGNLTLDFAGAAVISTAGITSSLGLNGTSSNAISASFSSKAVVSDAANSATSASYSLFASTTPAVLPTGSTQNITSSWANNVSSSNIVGTILTSSYATFAQTFPAVLPTGSTQNITASVALTAIAGGTRLATGSTVPITASVSLVAIAGGTQLATGSLVPITSSQALTASYVGTGTSGFLPAWTSGSVLSATSSVFQQNGLIGVNNTSPSVKLDVKGGTTSETILRVGSSTGDVVLLGQNQFAGGPFIQVNDNSNTSKILLQGAGDATFTNTGNVVLHPNKYVIVQGSVDGTRDTGIQFTGSNGDGTWMMDIDGFTAFDGGVISTTIAPSGDARFVGDVTASQFLANRISGSLFGTSSVAIKALTSTSASYSTFASSANTAISASWAPSSTTLSTGSTVPITASIAITSSYIANVVHLTGNESIAGVKKFTDNTQIVGLYDQIDSSPILIASERQLLDPASNVTLDFAERSLQGGDWSGNLTGSLFGTSSWATNVVNGIITASLVPITASWATTASFVKSASFAAAAGIASTIPIGTYNLTASWAISSSFTSKTASFATSGLSSSYAISSSWATNATQLLSPPSSSIFIDSAGSIHLRDTKTGIDWAYTDNAGSATDTFNTNKLKIISNIPASTQLLAGDTNGNVILSGVPITALNNLNVNTGSVITTLTGSNISVISTSTSSYHAAWYEYVAFSASNQRAGTVFGTFDGNNNLTYAEFTDVSLGNTDQVTMSISASLNNIQLITNVGSTYSWSIVANARYL